jgi:acyl-CoA synthetase (AMP-forming)/AMP-acid ligase II
VIERVRAQTPLEKVVLIGSADVPHDATFDDVLSSGEATVPEEPEEDDTVILMYTGGTTGLPKGVVIDSRATMLNMYKIATRWPIDEDFVYLHQTPMFHAASFGGVTAIPAIGGMTTFIPLFDPGAVLENIEHHKVSMTVMVPTMVQMLLDHPDFRPERLASMKCLTYGASPMPAALLKRLLEMLPDIGIYQGYGMTENCGLLTCLGPEEHRAGGELLSSAGRPVPGSVVSIQDEKGTILGPGEFGEVCARAGNYMKEYWHRPEETAAAFRDGWYHTGDAGRLDERGYLFLVDRVKDMIVTGGENVYSAEVENALASHPAVEQVAVIGIPSDQWGEAVHAIVVLRAGATATVEELVAWCKERIAGYKVPKSIDFRDTPLPLSGAMKVLKKDLRAPFWAGKERAVQ